MNEKHETIRAWAILVCAMLLSALSVWVMTVVYPKPFPMAGVMHHPEMAVRHGLVGVLALALAFGVGLLLPVRQVLRLRWVPLPLFALLLVAIPATTCAGWAAVIKGAAWWNRSPGWVAALLVTISGLMVALPRLACPDKKTRSGGQAAGMAAFAGVLVFAAGWSIHSSISLLFILFGMITLVVFVVLNGWRRGLGVSATVTVWGLVSAVLILMNPRLVTRRFPRQLTDAYYQGHQAQLSIHAGGWTGCQAHPPHVPEWSSDFIFSRICNVGGVTSGILLLILLGLLLTLAWRVVARQGRLENRALAAGCAAALTVRPLLHVAMNTGLWPIMPMPAPFLSYGLVFMLFDSLLLGVLVVLDRSATRRQRLVTDSPSRSNEDGKENDEAHFSRWPVTLVQVAIWMLLALFVSRLVWIVFGDPVIREQRRVTLQRIEARQQERDKPLRGRILDVHGRVLAQPGDRYFVCADPHFLAQSPDRHLHAELLRMIGLEAGEFERRTTNTARRYVRLANVPHPTAEAVRRMNLRGIFIDKQPSRDYPIATPLTHVAGFVNHEGVGGSGIEQALHRVLETGRDVRLTLDADLQQAVQSIAEQVGAREVQIVVMNPRTGAIRAAAQVPASHGDAFSTADPRSLTWRGNMDAFEPAGLVQPLVVAAALDAGVISTETPINTENGLWMYHGVPMRDPHPFAEMSPSDILILGGNIGMGKIGVEMGPNALHDAMVAWRLNAPAATCVPGAGAGMLHKPGQWSRVDVTRLPIGHGLACTLMQLVRAYTAFFNDGSLVEPCLTFSETLPEPVSVIHPATARWVRDVLTRGVLEGSAKNAGIEGVQTFGKTAVAQKILPQGGYCETGVQTAFIGGVELDKTACLIAVWLDEPVREPGFNPAPGVFREVAAAWMATDRTESPQ